MNSLRALDTPKSHHVRDVHENASVELSIDWSKLAEAKVVDLNQAPHHRRREFTNCQPTYSRQEDCYLRIVLRAARWTEDGEEIWKEMRRCLRGFGVL